MRQPHFVRDYRRVTANFIAAHPLDKAMSLAVGGGDYDAFGAIEADLLAEFGLNAGNSVIDIGCGSGRLSTQLAKRFGSDIAYLGVDVVPELLDYARGRASPEYRFELSEGLTIPAADASADFVVAFSVFTHLKHRETLAYLREAKRTLRVGGHLIFSFLELPYHAKIFAYTVVMGLIGHRKVQNHFISRRAILRWGDELGFKVEKFLPPERLGQTVAVLQKLA